MGMTRKEFLAGMSASAALGVLGEPEGPATSRNGKMAWSMYQQLGSHMWESCVKAPFAKNGHYCGETTHIDDESWERRMAKAAANGCNMMCIDLAEGLAYSSHPELAVEGSRSPKWMNDRVRKLRSLGIEAIPALNFSTAHDHWLGSYSRMISTMPYYRMARDLIDEVYDIFEKPSMINFGMDEENSDNTSKCQLSVRRQGDLLWHDIAFFARAVRRLGSRPWMWSDYVWWRRDDYLKRVAKDIVQTNWYYGRDFDYENMPRPRRTYVEAYLWLDQAGYDQMPCCSNYVDSQDRKEGVTVNTENIDRTLAFCKERLTPSRLIGFSCACWNGTSKRGDYGWFDACDQFAAARKKHWGS